MKYAMLADNVAALMLHLGDNQDQFADRLGVSQGTVSRWGKSMPRGDQIVTMAMLAGVLPSDFLATPLEKAPAGAYITLPVLTRVLSDALRKAPEAQESKARYLAQFVIDAVRLPLGLRDAPANDLDAGKEFDGAAAPQ